MQAVVADRAVADAVKDPVGVRRLRAGRADRLFEARLASSAKGTKVGAARRQAGHHGGQNFQLRQSWRSVVPDAGVHRD